MAKRTKEQPKNWFVFSCQQGVDMGSPNDIHLLGTVFGTKDQVWQYAKRTWPTFTGPWGSTETGEIRPAPPPADATREVPNATQLSTKAQKLLDNFDEAAQRWGWSSDQGSAKNANEDEEIYNKTLQKLVAYILELEQKVASIPSK